MAPGWGPGYDIRGRVAVRIQGAGHGCYRVGGTMQVLTHTHTHTHLHTPTDMLTHTHLPAHTHPPQPVRHIPTCTHTTHPHTLAPHSPLTLPGCPTHMLTYSCPHSPRDAPAPSKRAPRCPGPCRGVWVETILITTLRRHPPFLCDPHTASSLGRAHRRMRSVTQSRLLGR